MTIYEELQREQGIAAAVRVFYERVTEDPRLAHHFAGADVPKLRAHQAKLIAQVTGGPQRYAGRALAEAHEGLCIQDEDFDRVVEHLAATLSAAGVNSETIAAVAEVVGQHRGEIVSPLVDASV